MKTISVFLLAFCLNVQAAPDKVTLVDGTVLDHVSSVQVENGEVRVHHSGGIGRYAMSKISSTSQKELGFQEVQNDPGVEELQAMKRLETTDGKVYEDIRSVHIKPSFISFLYKEGAASVRFEKLSKEIQSKCGYNKELADKFDDEKKLAEEAIAKSEHNQEVKQYKAARNAAEIRRREGIVARLEMTSIGSNRYWLKDTRERALSDALTLRSLIDSGLSDAEARYYLNQAKFR